MFQLLHFFLSTNLIEHIAMELLTAASPESFHGKKVVICSMLAFLPAMQRLTRLGARGRFEIYNVLVVI